MPVEPGAWKVTFSIAAGRTARARAMIRTSVDGEFHGGLLDLRIYIPECLVVDEPMAAHAITAATAASDPCVTARIDSFFETLAQTFERVGMLNRESGPRLPEPERPVRSRGAFSGPKAAARRVVVESAGGAHAKRAQAKGNASRSWPFGGGFGGGLGPRPCLARSLAIASGMVRASSHCMTPPQRGQVVTSISNT